MKLRHLFTRESPSGDVGYFTADGEEADAPVPADPTTPRGSLALREYVASVREAEQRRTFLYDSLDGEPMVCERHGFRGDPSKPRPPAGLCPDCQAGKGQTVSTDFRGDPAERSEEEAASLERPVEVLAVQPYRDIGSEPMLRAWDEWKARQVESGQVLPGSPEEERAVERSNELRRRQVGSGRRPASHKIEDGTLVVFEHPPRRRKRKTKPPRFVRYDSGFDVEA